MHKAIVHQEFAPDQGVLSFYTYEVLTILLHDLVAAYPALAEMLGGRRDGRNLQEINRALRDATAALTAVGLLAIAAASAVAITGEREQDTWLSLATTLLTPGQAIRRKPLR